MTITRITEENSSRFTDFIPADLRNDLGREYFRGLVVLDENDTCKGAMVWEIKSLEDMKTPTRAEILCFEVFARPEGEALLQAFEESTLFDGVRQISFETEKMGDLQRDILADSGYSLKEEDSRDVVVTVSELMGLKLGDKAVPDYITSLSEITSRQFKAAVMISVFHGMYGLLDDLPVLPVTRFDPDLSSCVITDGKVRGLLLVHRNTNGSYIVELLFAVQPDANINLLNMIRRSVREAAIFCNMEDRVILRTHNQASGLLVRKLFPGKKGDRVINARKDNS